MYWYLNLINMKRNQGFPYLLVGVSFRLVYHPFLVLKCSICRNFPLCVEVRMVYYSFSAPHMKPTQRSGIYLWRNSNHHREHCFLPRSPAVTMRQLTQVQSFLARRADFGVAGPLASRRALKRTENGTRFLLHGTRFRGFFS